MVQPSVPLPRVSREPLLHSLRDDPKRLAERQADRPLAASLVSPLNVRHTHTQVIERNSQTILQLENPLWPEPGSHLTLRLQPLRVVLLVRFQKSRKSREPGVGMRWAVIEVSLFQAPPVHRCQPLVRLSDHNQPFACSVPLATVPFAPYFRHALAHADKTLAAGLLRHAHSPRIVECNQWHQLLTIFGPAALARISLCPDVL